MALGVLLFLASCQNKNGDLEDLKSQYDFAYSDTASISKVVISDKSPRSVVLQRTPSGWVVGRDSLPVRSDAIEVLLETLSQVTLKNFVTKQAQPAVLERMDVYGKWVEVFVGEQRVKHYVVGTETPDMLGTYYKMADGELPFSVYIQGFNGYLTTRFFTEEVLWRDRTIFGFAPSEIKSVELYNDSEPSSSWMVTRTSDADRQTVLEPANDPAIWSLVGGEFEPLTFTNSNDLLAVVASIRTLKYEGAVVESDPVWQKRDSIFSSKPAFTLYVHLAKEQKVESVQAFYKKADEGAFSSDGRPLRFDPDRFYAKLPDGRMVVIQRYGWRNLMKSVTDFNY